MADQPDPATATPAPETAPNDEGAACPYCQVFSVGTPATEALVCVCAEPCGAGRCRAIPAPPAPTSAAGVVTSGPAAEFVHLLLRTTSTGWVTACPASSVAVAEAGWQRQARPTLARIDCQACRTADRVRVDMVNRQVDQATRRESETRELVVEFLRWLAEEYPRDEGGVMLAVYAGGTKLHRLRPDERDWAIDLWLERRRTDWYQRRP